MLLTVILCITVLSSCVSSFPRQENTDELAVPETDETVVEIIPKHKFEMASTIWGFGTTSNICMVGDRGFFCIHLAERDIYPLWYDGDTLQMKSLNTEELLPIFKQYQLFTAGERLVACSEDNTVLNTLEPPYDKISSSVSIHDEGGNRWGIVNYSAIVFDREQDVIYCSAREGSAFETGTNVTVRIDLATGLIEQLPVPTKRNLRVIAPYANGVILTSPGQGFYSTDTGSGIYQFDVLLWETESDYQAEKINLNDYSDLLGMGFAEDGAYFSDRISQSLVKYDYNTRTMEELCPIEGITAVSTGVSWDGKLRCKDDYLGGTSNDAASNNHLIYFDTKTCSFLTTKWEESGDYPSNLLKRVSGWNDKYVCLPVFKEDGGYYDFFFVTVEDYWNGDLSHVISGNSD